VSFNIFNIYKNKKQTMPTPPIRISLNGQLFSSINQAAKTTKISTRQIKKKLKDLDDPSCFELIDLPAEEASLLPSFYKRRGKDRNPRATGEAHGNFVHGLGKTRGWESAKHSAWKQGVFSKYGFLPRVLLRVKPLIYNVTIWTVGGLNQVVTTLTTVFH
jgi:hypothetical protein